jgi:hypothetical protein
MLFETTIHEPIRWGLQHSKRLAATNCHFRQCVDARRTIYHLVCAIAENKRVDVRVLANEGIAGS